MSLAAIQPREMPLWWSMPLAVVLWALILWGFGFFLAAPEVEPLPSTPPMPIDARFVELPDSPEQLRPSPARPPSQASPAAPNVRPQAKPRQRVPTPPAPRAVEPVMPVRPLEQAPPPPLEQLNLKPPPEAAPTDMQSYVNAMRARRQAAEESAGRPADAAGKGREPSADEVRMANIMRNLKPTGTNGVFQILNLSVRTARFSFRAWTTNTQNPSREIISVMAEPGGSIELAVVRRMIELIRIYYKGDFNWESQTYGRVVLSARLEDSAQLEDFLMREFFGVGAKNVAQ